MSRFGILLARIADHPLLARLCVASVELLVLAALLALLLRVWRPASRRLAALLWLAVLLKPVVSLAIGDPVALFHVEAAPAAAAVAPAPASGLPETGPVAARVDVDPQAVARQERRVEGAEPSKPADVAPRELSAAPIAGAATPLPPDPARWLLGAWLLGAIAFLARRLQIQRRLRRLVAAADAAPAPFLRRHEKLAREAGLREIPALRVTDALESPALVGSLRPAVLLPRWMVERGLDRTVEAGLRHELAHCRYSDPLALLVRDAALILFFFHPAAWWAGRRLAEALELACDRDCLRDPADAPLYAESLYEILRRIRARRAAACARSVLGFATPGRVARRITSLVDGRSLAPLTRGAAVAAALFAVALLATGFTLAPAAPNSAGDSAPQAAPKRREKPDVFLLGPLRGEAFDAFAKSTSGRIFNLWGRGHDPGVYDDLFTNPKHPFGLKPDDVLVVLLTADLKSPVPEKYRDLLPQPWETIEAALKKGETVELEHSVHDLDVVVLGAKDGFGLEKLLATTAKLASLRSAPSPANSLRRATPTVFLLGSLSGEAWKAFEDATGGRIGSLWGRPHEPRIYDDLFENPKHPFHMTPGDVLVVLLTPAAKCPVPEKFGDLLPQPWETIEAALKRGETVELEHSAHDLDVVVLGARDQGALETLLATTAKLASLRSRRERPAATKLPAGVRYVVTIDENDRRNAAVHVEVPDAGAAVRFAMSSGARHLEGGYSHFLGGLEAKSRDGRPLAVEPVVDHDRYSVTVDRPAALDYHVALQHDSAPWPEGGPDEAPYATANDVFWTGRALFLGADFDGAEVEFRIPGGWRVSTPWEPVAGRRNTFRVRDFDDLKEAFILAGTHQQLEAKCGGLHVVLAVGADLGETAQSLRDGVQRLLDAGGALFGGTPPGRKLLVANRGVGSGMNGGVFGQSISLLSDRGFDAAEAGRWFPFVAHEIVHLWNGGGGGMRSRDHDAWFSEGFTEYDAWVLSTRLGLATRDGFLDRVRQACKAYAAQAGSAALHDADSRALQYDGGFSAALCLDLRLRHGRPGSKGLDDLMREMFTRFGATQKPYASSDVAAVAASLAGNDLDRFFARFVDGRERLPLEADLATAGLELRIDESATLLSRDYAIHDVLHIRSLTQNGAELLVRRSGEAGYQDGDLLQAVDGAPVRSFGDLQRVLIGKEPGRDLEITVHRGDRAETIHVKAGGRDSAPTEHVVDVELSPKSGADTSLLDRILAQ